jgi:succinate dehydrogenase / fumarate reductase flavoprotein subunit
MRIYPAVHYTMGGLWVDYNLMSNLPGLHVIGEANFSDHGANRLGASALMQGLADGYFVLPYTIGAYLATAKQPKVTTDAPEFREAVARINQQTAKFLSIKGKRTVDSFHRQLGAMMWEKCGMARDEKGLKELLQEIPALRQEFWENVNILGSSDSLNTSLEKAGRVADFFEFAEVLALDALERNESCGGHYRTEWDDEGEAKRDDSKFMHAAVWEYQGEGQKPLRNVEPLVYETFHPSVRSYK